MSDVAGADAVRLSGSRLAALALLWGIVQIVCFAGTGIRIVGDAPRYVGAAQALVTEGSMPEAVAGFPALVVIYAVLLTLGGPAAVVVGQALLSLAATLRMATTTALIYRPFEGLVAGALFAGWWEIQRRNYFLLTTSLFVSFTALALCQVMRARTPRSTAWAIALLSVVALLRPEGVLVAGALGLAMCLRLAHAGRHRTALALGAVGLLVSVMLVARADAAARRADVGGHLAAGTVIWGHPESAVDPLAGSRPGEPSGEARDVLDVAVGHPGHALRVWSARITTFLRHTKPYYSERHNAFLVLTYLPVWLLLLAGLSRAPRAAFGRVALCAPLAAQAVFVALTFEDWSGRWLLHAMPGVLILAAGGGGLLAARFQNVGRGLSGRGPADPP